ncbi:hypothetical protein FIV00_03525 [Labrenzia sp. THAF82]|uniref:hypothetical protein n=1 Tax=Labrenzia sp. THAF82 TaxID=2587861 RepID=UPI001267CFCE|nr:hypothetical protein [Labrenzia sp. THAF82]QFT29539.1 hypothetical protein FIV00_03525 [Labrenzia sp. THAF82]
MFPKIKEIDLPAWIIGAPMDDGVPENAQSMILKVWLKKLKPVFPKEPLKELYWAAKDLDSERMGRLIAQKTLSPDKSLQELLNKS